MPLDSAESIDAAFAGLAIGQAIMAAVQAMPPSTIERPRKVADFAPVLAIVQEKVLPLIDKVAEDVAD